MPRLTTTQRLSIVGAADGLQVYDTSLKGFYYFNTTSNKWDCVTTPAGTVNYFANVNSPIGYLECNGQSVSTTQYPELFNAIGYLYGGAGANFNVPDLRGEFVRGVDNGKGLDAGRILGTSQEATAIRALIDTYDTSVYPIGTYAVGARNIDGFIYGPGSETVTSGLDNIYYQSAATANGGAGDNYSFKVRPRNVALLPCIKY